MAVVVKLRIVAVAPDVGIPWPTSVTIWRFDPAGRVATVVPRGMGLGVGQVPVKFMARFAPAGALAGVTPVMLIVPILRPRRLVTV